MLILILVFFKQCLFVNVDVDDVVAVQDPILTAFELSWELRRLAFSEHEFKSEYLVGADVDEAVEDYC